MPRAIALCAFGAGNRLWGSVPGLSRGDAPGYRIMRIGAGIWFEDDLSLRRCPGLSHYIRDNGFNR